MCCKCYRRFLFSTENFNLLVCVCVEGCVFSVKMTSSIADKKGDNGFNRCTLTLSLPLFLWNYTAFVSFNFENEEEFIK